jgi:hypothetical protein
VTIAGPDINANNVAGEFDDPRLQYFFLSILNSLCNVAAVFTVNVAESFVLGFW